jgi:hypothetical protein
MASEILSYLTRNPRAQDTLSGIADWWLASELAEDSCAQVEEAVERLRAEGLLTVVEGADGRVRYGLAPGRVAAALRWLAEHRSEEEGTRENAEERGRG